MKLIWTLFIALMALVSFTIGFPSEDTVEQPTTEAWLMTDADGNVVNCLETPGKSFYDGCNYCDCYDKPEKANQALCTARLCPGSCGNL